MINTKHLLKVFSAWTTLVYTICYAGVAIYPPIRQLTAKYAFHIDATIASTYFGIGYFIVGLIVWNVVALLGVWLFAFLFNKIKE